ncbi:MAG: Gamma-glutamyltranspeptidase [Gammaproteobacteria bacterium]|nr:Gamma-glutamyltranspeptidase [Gammaproteobacteria bacterium]NIR23753.1 Gamma-glutamyltranspeptidase [Gammaproteobacteria bacterium]NIS05167.1 Gamma-glutamyltranspeptidase [Gammaproteobacteria bacterium]NIU40803.1 Gamma-glutamyltranspeptidase [Gammaproteobacteria bacterium]NIV47692.1 Gamma-glutamyltranspeptidase [Gammaproteobacteria bacterium]
MGKPRGVVAAGHTLTAEAAAEVLRAGGNAFDAALAALAVASVVEPVLCTPGGGGFLLAHPAREKPRVYDFFVHTPSRRLPESSLDFRPILADFGGVTQEFHIGLGTVAVPGLVRGLFEIHRDLGTLPMRDILAQAVTHAKDGVTVTPFQAYVLGVVSATFTATQACQRIFRSARDAEALVGEGECLRQPELADTLETLAIEGDDLFYRGEIAAAIARDMHGGGQITFDDLAGYAVERRVPLTLDYHGVRMLTNPPPSSGGLLIAFGLKLLQSLDAQALGFATCDYLDTLVRVIGATAEARVAAGGDAHLDADVMLDETFVARYRNEIAGRAASRRGTTQISVIDADGSLASLTVSNGEGSGYVVPETGIVMNNMLGEEDLNPGGFQRWPEAHRMTSMMAPSALEWPNGDRIALGSGGSNRLRTAILQVLLNVIDFGLHVEDAVHAPRVHYENGHLSVEGGFDMDRLGALLEAFPDHHVWDRRNMFFGGVHTVMAGEKGMQGTGDARRGGASLVCEE